MSRERDEHSELKMPSLNETEQEMQFTGKGWVPVDAEKAQAELEALQRQLAARQEALVHTAE